jgi:hypothetical protein
LNIIDRDLAANRPDRVRLLDVGNMTSHSHHTDRANKAGGAVAWLLKLQSKMLGDAYLLFSCRASQGLSQFNLYVMWLLWEEKVLIREI